MGVVVVVVVVEGSEREREDRIEHAAIAFVYSSIMVWKHARPVADGRLQKSHLLDELQLVGVCGDFSHVVV